MKKWLLLGAVALSAVATADEAGARRAFEKAKRTEPELIAFLKGMPKGGDLHNHASGALYSDYLLDNAVRQGLFFDPATSTFTTDSSKVPAARLLQDNRLLYQFLNAASMRGWMGGGESGHDHFFATFGIFGTARRGLSREATLAEVVGRARAQNLQYMELMAGVSPGDAEAEYFRDVPKSDDMETALEVLRPRLEKLLAATGPFLDVQDAALSRLLALPSSVTGSGGPINIRYVWSAGRLSPNDDFFAQIAAGLYLAAKDRRIVALNIVAPEDHPNARVNFDWQMRAIDFLWRQFGKPKVTLHAGELTLPISPPEMMRDRIRKSIAIGRASRIGHGVSIAWEDDLPGLLKMMREQGIAVEICLSSNASILGVSGDRHPLKLYREAKVPVFLNTDDEGVSRSNMTMEWVRAVREQGIGYEELKEMARNSIEYSFLSGASLYRGRDYRRLHPALQGARSPVWTPSEEAKRLLGSSDRMQIQLRLERAFVEFENRYPSR